MKRKAPTLRAPATNTPTIAPAAAPALFIPLGADVALGLSELDVGVVVTVVMSEVTKG